MSAVLRPLLCERNADVFYSKSLCSWWRIATYRSTILWLPHSLLADGLRCVFLSARTGLEGSAVSVVGHSRAPRAQASPVATSRVVAFVTLWHFKHSCHCSWRSYPEVAQWGEQWNQVHKYTIIIRNKECNIICQLVCPFYSLIIKYKRLFFVSFVSQYYTL